MDFGFSDEQQAVSDLAGRILGDRLPPERVREVEDDPDGRWFAADVWAEVAKAELLGLCLPDDVGGSGYGLLEVCLLLEQQGRTVAPLPLLPTLILGALPINRFGSAAQRAAVLPGVVRGDTILTAALHEAGSYARPDVPATSASADAGGGWRLDGEKHLVPAAHLADRILVPARTGEDAVGVFLVHPAAAGISIDLDHATTGEPLARVTLDGVAVPEAEVLGDPSSGAEIVAWIADRAVAGLCATTAGVCGRALEITAHYVSEREQFGSKLGTFQAVSQRAADAFIDTEAIRLTAWEAAWRLSVDLPAAEHLATAKFWAAEGGQRVVHACQHLHGGIGVDTDYPIHRYFRWAKVLELTLGGATASLLRLGAILAAEPV
jgi:alkylation response protein AidB-like acyl-CoA dehydrogenase